MQRAGKARRASSDDENIRFELFALNGHLPLDLSKTAAKNS
jgi:hypothetical protein